MKNTIFNIWTNVCNVIIFLGIISVPLIWGCTVVYSPVASKRIYRSKPTFFILKNENQENNPTCILSLDYLNYPPNLTMDSFNDANKYTSPEAVVAKWYKLFKSRNTSNEILSLWHPIQQKNMTKIKSEWNQLIEDQIQLEEMKMSFVNKVEIDDVVLITCTSDALLDYDDRTFALKKHKGRYFIIDIWPYSFMGYNNIPPIGFKKWAKETLDDKKDDWQSYQISIYNKDKEAKELKEDKHRAFILLKGKILNIDLLNPPVKTYDVVKAIVKLMNESNAISYNSWFNYSQEKSDVRLPEEWLNLWSDVDKNTWGKRSSEARNQWLYLKFRSIKKLNLIYRLNIGNKVITLLKRTDKNGKESFFTLWLIKEPTGYKFTLGADIDKNESSYNRTIDILFGHRDEFFDDFIKTITKEKCSGSHLRY